LRDSSFYGSQKKLMTAQVLVGPGVRGLSPLELAILKDLGYGVVPVPGSAAILVVGVLFVRRRREDQVS
jgi:hypothetical protein